MKSCVAFFLACLGFAVVGAEPVPPQAQLNSLLDEDLAAVFRRAPLLATLRGVPGYDDLLSDLSFATLEKERARERRTLVDLRAIDPKALQGQDRVSYELLLDKMESAVEGQRFRNAEGLVLSLAATFTLAVKTHSYGGNVSGPFSASLRALFSDMHRDQFAAVEEIAVRIRVLGTPAPSACSRPRRCCGRSGGC